MLNTIKVLEQIQKIDLEIRAVEEEEKRYLRLIAELGAGLKTAEDGMAQLDSEVNGLKTQLQEIDERIRESTEKVSKDEKRLNSIKNDKEFNALTKEMNGANRTKKQGEQEKTNLSSRITEKEAALNEKKAAAEKQQQEIEGLRKELEEKKIGWKEGLEERMQTRDSVKAGLRSDILRKYEMIRSKRGGLGLVLVKDEICQGCFTHIPPQVYIILKRGTEELLSCPHCHRLLYVESQGQLEAV